MKALSNEEAVSVVRNAIVEVAPEVTEELDTLEDGADLWDLLELDSMDHQTVMVGLFERTGIDIPEHEYGRLRSLSALAGHLVEATA